MAKITKFALFMIVICSALISCDKSDDNPANIVNFTASLNGANEVPSNPSTATGSVTGTFDKNTKIFNMTLTYSGMTATNMHIHKGAAGVSGGVLFGIGAPPFASPVSFTSVALSTGQEDSLMNSLYYVNVHSATYPAGEIRGQLLKQ